ncbi:MAG TPA: heterodisulfide reductase-related iron-sulfur binding cluster, partial [Ruminococcus sp.]|nr:heterodisulfide reductase-related iron-sulfur binding cluster [Ruminococcus sp.]
ALAMDDPENPTIMEDFIRAIGATPVIYAQRNECCGGYITLEDKSQAAKRSGAVMESAKDQGADMIITACPLCLYNLRKNSGSDLPVYDFTEILAQALGLKEGNNE